LNRELVGRQILFFLMALWLLQPRLLSQTEANSDTASNENTWTATTEDKNPLQDSIPTKTHQIHTEANGRTVDKTVTERRGFDGSYGPYLETEKESGHVDSGTVRTVERLFGRDPNGGRTLIRMTEEESRSLPDGQTQVIRTVSDSTVNGDLQVVKRELQDTRQIGSNVQETTTTVLSPDVNGGFSPTIRYQERSTRGNEQDVQFKRTTLLPDGSGNWQVHEVRQGTITGENRKNQTKEESVWRRSTEGNLSVVERIVSKQTEGAQGEERKTVETFSNTVPGGFGDGSLILNQRVTTVRHPQTDGGEITEGQIEQKNPGDPRAGVRLTQKRLDIVRPKISGATEEEHTIQSLDSNGGLSTVWVDTREKTGGNSIEVDTRKAEGTTPVQVNTREAPKP
jgi:hypothetical protein